MEGRATTFKKVLADFESRLAGAEFVAIDTELTGVDLEGEPDTFEESADVRLDKMCRIAERYSLIQIGLTIVSRAPDGVDGHYCCNSYNLFAFPYVGPEMGGRDAGFFCQASALQFNAQHRVNFNMWIGEGIPYMSREDEKRLIRNQPGENHVDEKVGLLRLWRALCAARLPFVVHCPLDLFFLLAAFERRPLPRDNPRALAVLIRQCTPKVYDTAHLHGQIGRYKRLGLMKYFEDVQAQYEELALTGHHVVPAVQFQLMGDTEGRYRKGFSSDEALAHEAGFDSLVTAQLFVYLRAISPGQVKEAANRLFLYRSVEYLDLEKAAVDGKIAHSMFDLTRVTLLVAALDPVEGLDSPRRIMASGFTCKWMDNSHVLVVIRASGGAAVRKAAELAAKVPGVAAWMPFEQWRQLAVQAAEEHKAENAANGVSAGTYSRACDHEDEDEAALNGLNGNTRHDVYGCEADLSHGSGFNASWVFRLLACSGAAGVLLLLVSRGSRGQQLPAAAGPIKRLCLR